MAKFCSKCGAQMDDEDKVCGQCGTPFAGELAKAAEKEPKKAGSGLVKLIVGVIVAVVILVVAANILGNYTGYKGTINKMVKALQNDDVATMESLSSSIAEETLWLSNDLYDYYEELMSNTLDQFEDNVGTIKKITYEITDETEISERRLENLKDNLTEAYNMDTSGIQKIVKVDLKLTVKGAKKSSSHFVKDLYMIKESGGWKFYYGFLNF